MSSTTSLLILVLLLFLNAYFVAAEFALVSARRDQIEPKASTGSWPARATLRAMESVSLSMACCQLGITVCSLGIGAVGEPAIAHLLAIPFAAVGLPEALVHPVALVLALVIVVFLHMLLGEMVPKNITLSGPDRAAFLLGPPLYVLCQFLRPIVWIMNGTANLVLKAMRVEPRNEVNAAFTNEELRGFVAESGREGLLDEDELRLLQGALEFETLTAGQVCIPAEELVTVPRGVTVSELEELSARTGFSRFPVEVQGELIGYVHLKNLLTTPAHERDAPVPDTAIVALGEVQASDRLRAVIDRMQERSHHLARVQGMQRPGHHVVTLEDVLEELVGEVRDATSVSREDEPV
ncbi:hemolysin family protein [Gephyromycinifex aptenodytis]|uniref:hemolysin family protein n=1 Tax=Gephyromycinifex aptenodytis TaxID=2716227 RepID=UPI0014462C83|nr:hemolysin family protein [Gephyromycinifex aptenodytis]